MNYRTVFAQIRAQYAARHQGSIIPSIGGRLATIVMTGRYVDGRRVVS